MTIPMQQISNLFDKYKDIKVTSDGTLFGLDCRVAYTHNACPLCFHKLYSMRDRPLLYCKNKTHRPFIMKKK